MSAITVKTDLPAEFIVLSQELIEKKDALIERAFAAPITSPVEMKSADTIAKDIARLFKQVEENRLTLSREVRAKLDQLNEAAAEALVPLKDAWDALAKRLKAFEDEEKRLYQERLRKAEEERLAKQKEADERAAREADEAKRRAAMEAEPGDEPAPAPEVTEHLPERVEAAYVPPPPKSSAVASKGGKVVTVVDERAVPFEINGVRLWKEVNRTAAKALWDNGVAVPGTVYEKPEGFAMRGGRA